MNFRFAFLTGPLLLAACAGDPVAEDIKEFNELADKTVSKSGTDEMMSKMRAATTNEEKSKLLGEYASATRKQAETLSAFKADTPEMEAISEKIAGGLNKAADGAAAGQKAFASGEQSDASKASSQMNEGFREFMAGASEMRKLAKEKNVSLKID